MGSMLGTGRRPQRRGSSVGLGRMRRSLLLAMVLVLMAVVAVAVLFAGHWDWSDGTTQGRGPEDSLLWDELLSWKSLFQAALPGKISKESRSLDHQILKQCWESSSWLFLYTDPLCTLTWMRVLAHQRIVKADSILAVVSNKERKEEGIDAKSQQNGGMRGFFGDAAGELSMKGYWKPCAEGDLKSNRESYKGEVLAFLIDRLLGFYRTPAVVPRTFSERELMALANTAKNATVAARNRHAMDTILDRCGDSSATKAEGAMVGWANKEVKLLLKKKHQEPFFVDFFHLTEERIAELKEERFTLTSASSPEKIRFALENVAVNMFAIITNNYNRFNHNLFIMLRPDGAYPDMIEYGPFIYLDNDRSKWRYHPIEEGKIEEVNAFNQFCVFPRSIARRLLLLRPGHASSSIAEKAGSSGRTGLEKTTFGTLLHDVSSIYDGLYHGELFTLEQAAYMDGAVEVLTDAITSCVDKYGEENVLFDEPWRQSHTYDALSTVIGVLKG